MSATCFICLYDL